MGMFKDTNNVEFKGLFKMIARNIKTGEEKILDEENLVVAQARLLMRDLVANVSDTSIKRLQIGDMNKDLGDDVSDLGNPAYSDTKLENSFFSKDYEKREVIEYEGRPAIKYTFVINEDEANDADNDDYNRKLWCEYALISTKKDSSNNEVDDRIWNRKIKPIIKDNETEITIYWIFIF
jgi:hypothetical protein